MKCRKHFWPVTAAGIVSAALLALLLARLPETYAEDILLALVGVFGGIYFGVGLASAGMRNKALNFAMATLFVGFALAGSWVSPMFFALACFAHAAWDVVIDHPKGLHEPIAQWYMPVCVGADLVLGVFVLLWWW